MLSEQTIQELEEELHHLDQRSNAIRQILGQERAWHPSTLPGVRSSEKTSDEPFEDVGLREAIRMVLRENNKGMKAAAIAKELERRGFENRSKLDLPVRISNELGRMGRARQLERIRPGIYTIADEDGMSS